MYELGYCSLVEEHMPTMWEALGKKETETEMS
jgi:hypothetical protein